MKVSSVNLGKGLSWNLEAIFITTIVPRTWELDSAVYCSFLVLCGKQQDWETAEWNLLLARASRHCLLFLNPNSKFYICKRHESNERSHALLLAMVFMWANGQHVCFKGLYRTFSFCRLVLLWSQDRHPGMVCQFLGLHFTILRNTHNFMHFAKHAVRA